MDELKVGDEVTLNLDYLLIEKGNTVSGINAKVNVGKTAKIIKINPYDMYPYILYSQLGECTRFKKEELLKI